MWHTLSEKSVVDKLESCVNGLSRKEAAKRLERFGENRFETRRRSGVIKSFFGQLSDTMVIMLLVAVALSLTLSYVSGDGEYLDAVIILAIVIFNATIGVIQEFKAENALEELEKMNSPTTTVLRDGAEEKIKTSEVVPGDIVLLSAGDYVPADARLIEAVMLTVDESALTGETEDVEKRCRVEDVKQPEEQTKNMVWAQTVVTGGRGKAVVVATGMNTKTGKIAGMIIEGGSEPTPLQQRLKKTGNVIGVGATVICALIFLMGILRGQPTMEMFMTSVSLAVAAIPEGLPAIITVMLAIGVRKMAKKNAVVRKLPAVETLGSTTVICTDKTGTITCNEMTVSEIYGNRNKFLECCCLCNNDRGSTEKALIKAALSEGILKEKLDGQKKRVGEIPFSSERKIMTTVHKNGEGYITIIKGAPEKILNCCALSEEQKRDFLQKNSQMAKSGNRVIAAAFKESQTPDSKEEKNFMFAGLAAMTDPPRRGVEKAVEDCKKAGIRVIMITGDQKDTALAVAAQTGIGIGGRAVEGREIDAMTDEQLKKAVAETTVFARVNPQHKTRIVRTLQSIGNVVAMTGDGVNDAAALKYSDIGCAMGKSGTEVAKGAADIVLTDDNFVTIAEAVKQGRGIYENIRKTVRFLLSSNIGEIFTIFAAIFFGRSSPLTAIQLLWTNLVTDCLPAIALGLEPADKDIMTRKPVRKNSSLFGDGVGLAICLEGIMIGMTASLAYAVGTEIYHNFAVGRTMTFCTLSLSQLFQALAVESEHSIFSRRMGRNGFMAFSFVVCAMLQIITVAFAPARRLLGTSALTTEQWLVTMGLSAIPLIVSEFEKLAKKTESKRYLVKNIKNA
ncbi:MAG: cation-translocating P-type ATPase [Clostridia bacterium]|nr:cation-translocating P-type ATPase [Clostridia bacterium]